MAQTRQTFQEKYGPWALVTGASSGIGAAIASRLADRGLNLILVARRADALDALALRLSGSHGIDVKVVLADLGQSEEVSRVVAQIAAVDIGLYVASAGFGTSGAFADNDLGAELNMIDVNCRALTALAHPLAAKMQDRGRGGMIFLSSIVAFQGVAQSANYAATKAFVQSFAEGLAIELAPQGIDVLASAPGPVATEFSTRADMRMSGAADPDTIAKATLAALGKARTTRPGFQSKLLGYGLATLPRPLRTRILTRIMTGMTKHRYAD